MNPIDTFLSEWTDAERAGDVATLDALLTDDFVGVGPMGFTLTKPEWLERHRPGELEYETFALDERQDRRHGDAAVVTARQSARGTHQGRPVPETLRATLTLTAETGTWRLAGIQMSFVAGTPGAPGGPPLRDGAVEHAAEHGGRR
jgi:ketosteroid isomerase-like protein